jgi:enamine deaminase RidA (YjgF/YER057c/UK114 family)
MSKLDDRLAELGLTIPEVAKPVAAYVPAVVTGNLVYTSGQLPFVDGKLPSTGKVGGAVSPEAAKEMARYCVLNGLAAVKSVIGSLDRVTRIVKVVGFVASEP